jgi:putative SOS response-associated peptidase YedK
MCGRYTLSSPSDLLADLMEVKEAPELAARYNIAPTQEAPILRMAGESSTERELLLLKWGLVPFWADDPAIGNRMINARSETVAEKPSFRTSFKKRRCAVLADGFYEWKKTGSRKQPFFFCLKSRRPFGMAGLWDCWDKGEGPPLETFTILTTSPNEVVAEAHHRMPVILSQPDLARWLDPGADVKSDFETLWDPYPAAEMEGFAVSTYVNNPANDTPRCIEPIRLSEG